VHKDIAMTGEITLRGRVLPIGGLKSKILAAHLSGAKAVILPLKNQKDLLDVPDEIRKQMKLVLVESMDQVLEHALVRVPKALDPKPAEIVDKGEPMDEDKPAAPDKMRRGFPGSDQPPAIATPAQHSTTEAGAGG
jgi:ATP-dependent Lon protease